MFPVISNGIIDDFAGSRLVLEIIDSHFLILKYLILFKKIAQLEQKMLG
jgi:hypothetical protein